MDIKIIQLQDPTQQDADQISNLLAELSVNTPDITLDRLRTVCTASVVFIAYDGAKIVGCIVVLLPQQLTKGKAWIEDLVVRTKYRGKGIGTQLTLQAIDYAKAQGAVSINATTSRIASLVLVKKLGFEVRDSKLVRLNVG